MSWRPKKSRRQGSAYLSVTDRAMLFHASLQLKAKIAAERGIAIDDAGAKYLAEQTLREWTIWAAEGDRRRLQRAFAKLSKSR